MYREMYKWQFYCLFILCLKIMVYIPKIKINLTLRLPYNFIIHNREILSDWEILWRIIVRRALTRGILVSRYISKYQNRERLEWSWQKRKEKFAERLLSKLRLILVGSRWDEVSVRRGFPHKSLKEERFAHDT